MNMSSALAFHDLVPLPGRPLVSNERLTPLPVQQLRADSPQRGGAEADAALSEARLLLVRYFESLGVADRARRAELAALALKRAERREDPAERLTLAAIGAAQQLIVETTAQGVARGIRQSATARLAFSFAATNGAGPALASEAAALLPPPPRRVSMQEAPLETWSARLLATWQALGEILLGGLTSRRSPQRARAAAGTH